MPDNGFVKVLKYLSESFLVCGADHPGWRVLSSFGAAAHSRLLRCYQLLSP